jgi:sarcosine oxidase
VRIAVVGGGVVGMSTTAALIDAGHDVACFEPRTVMGERSAGSTRIFRLAHADPDLVRIAQASRDAFGRWSGAAGRPMVVDSGCVVTGTDMADRAAAMAAAGAAYELIGIGSDRLHIPVVDMPAVALLDVGGGVVDVDAVRDHLAGVAGHAVVPRPVGGGRAGRSGGGGVGAGARAGRRRVPAGDRRLRGSQAGGTAGDRRQPVLHDRAEPR